MTVNIKVVRSFLGIDNTQLLNVRGTPYKAAVTFAEIRIPKSAIKLNPERFGELEEEHECTIEEAGGYVILKPKLIKKYPFIYATVPVDGSRLELNDQQRELKEWLIKHGKPLLVKLLRLGGG